jgi:hypothetical protein
MVWDAGTRDIDFVALREGRTVELESQKKILASGNHLLEVTLFPRIKTPFDKEIDDPIILEFTVELIRGEKKLEKRITQTIDGSLLRFSEILFHVSSDFPRYGKSSLFITIKDIKFSEEIIYYYKSIQFSMFRPAWSLIGGQ